MVTNGASELDRRVPLVPVPFGATPLDIGAYVREQRAADLLVMAKELYDEHGDTCGKRFGRACAMCSLVAEWRLLAQGGA